MSLLTVGNIKYDAYRIIVCYYMGGNYKRLCRKIAKSHRRSPLGEFCQLIQTSTNVQAGIDRLEQILWLE